MNNKLLSVIAFLAVALFSTNAFSGSFNIGAAGAIANVEASGTETPSLDTSDSSDRSKEVSNNVFIGSVFAEYESDYLGGLTLGFEYIPGSADVSSEVQTRTDTEKSVSGDATQNADERQFKANAEIENYHSVYVELPVGGGPFFVRGGMAQIDVNTNEVKSSNGGSYGNATLDGYNIGLGLKGTMGNGLGVKFYYEQTDFDTLSLTSTGNSADSGTNSISADLDVQAVKLAVSYKF